MRLAAASVLFIVLVFTFWQVAASPSHPEASTTIYDSNPSHLWNRVYAALLIRADRHGTEFGVIRWTALWAETEHLLWAIPRARIARLDEFLQTHGERRFTIREARRIAAGPLGSVRLVGAAIPGEGWPQYDKEEGTPGSPGGSVAPACSHARRD